MGKVQHAHAARRMLSDRIEGKWIDAFREVFARPAPCSPGDAVAILSETQSRALNVQLAELALHALGARAFHVVVPTPRNPHPVPVRSTGASEALAGLEPALAALQASALVVDLTIEGLMHARETPAILARRRAHPARQQRASGGAGAAAPGPGAGELRSAMR